MVIRFSDFDGIITFICSTIYNLICLFWFESDVSFKIESTDEAPNFVTLSVALNNIQDLKR